MALGERHGQVTTTIVAVVAVAADRGRLFRVARLAQLEGDRPAGDGARGRRSAGRHAAAAGAGQPAAGAAARHVPHRARAPRSGAAAAAWRPPTPIPTPTPASPRASRWPACSPSSVATPRRSSATRKSSARRASSSIYGRTARLGLGEAQLAQGKNDAAVDHVQSDSRPTATRSCRSTAF